MIEQASLFSLSRQKHLENLKLSHAAPVLWDLIVIGGGATGLGAAVDAASRGLKVLLLESHDFAKGTSSRSTKLAHGGVRYLAQGRLKLVREALKERASMLHNAPKLVKPLPFVVPIYQRNDGLLYWLGLKCYSLLAGKLGLGSSRWLSPAEVLQALPTVKHAGLCGGIRYFDAQFDDARLAIALMKTLHQLGGTAINYMPVVGLIKPMHRIEGVLAQDHFTSETFHLHAKAVLNATGVWVDALRQMDNPQSKPLVSPSQGIHIVVDASFHPSAEAMLIPKTADGRVLFVLPWQGKTLVGTTDTKLHTTPHEPHALASEVAFILKTAAQYLIKAPQHQDIRSVFVGLRPLVKPAHSEGKTTPSISREHTIVVEESGLVSITGGKWTTYRSMAEEVINLIAKKFTLTEKSSTTHRLRLQDDMPSSTQTSIHPRIQLSIEEIHHAVHHEMAITVEDILARRNRALFLDSEAALECLDTVADTLQALLGLSDVQIEHQKRDFIDLQHAYAYKG